MINFRYHLVSLIAVFLALAVGIVLGIGPLRGPASDEVASQVSQLRDRNDQLRDEATQANASAQERDNYLTQTADQIVGQLLAGQHYELVTVGDVSGSVRDAVRQRLEQAGATKAGEVRVTATWWSDGASDALAEAVAQLHEKLPDLVTGEDDEQTLLDAFHQALVSDPPDTSGPGRVTKDILDTLRGAKLISGDVSQRASAIVVVYQQFDTDQQPATIPPSEVAQEDFGVRLADQFSLGLVPVIAIGPATDSGETIAQIRSDDVLRRRLSSVDNADELTGQLSVPRALSAQFNGVIGHYGTASNATGPLVGETESTSALVPPYLKANPGATQSPGSGGGS